MLKLIEKMVQKLNGKDRGVGIFATPLSLPFNLSQSEWVWGSVFGGRFFVTLEKTQKVQPGPIGTLQKLQFPLQSDLLPGTFSKKCQKVGFLGQKRANHRLLLELSDFNKTTPIDPINQSIDPPFWGQI